ncbi:hypothetical protein C7U92_14440 [Bradyrhizobium sp. WBOS7]|nr:hypothetical protein [Bradyrhizobium sp. WBOS2]MDD1571600.1 hypothetical protein [Bradyrhizobium sp. WBOS1]MDD1577922.1 hypothetical protein [Bradyrhizobium sp. WBOS7]MDD1599960.1 hypothetical protein [Bradyrhizobium sp. WBOS16]
MLTTGAAECEELKANPSFRRDHSRDEGRINPIRPGPFEYQGCARVPRRRQNYCIGARESPLRHGRVCPGLHALPRGTKNVDARDKPGHDDLL